MKRTLYLATLTATVCAFSCGVKTESQANLENQKEPLEQANNSIATELQDFINEAVSDGMMQVSIAEIAIDRSDDFEIDQIAETIRLDHRSAGTELKSIAASKGWTLPVTMIDWHQRKADNLENSNSADFDGEYLNAIIASHEDAIARFEKCADKGYDQHIVSWINKRLPVLHQHLENCKELSGRLAEGS